MKTEREIIRALIRLQGDVKAMARQSNDKRGQRLDRALSLLQQAENEIAQAEKGQGKEQ